jgi:hypothetical protein
MTIRSVVPLIKTQTFSNTEQKLDEDLFWLEERRPVVITGPCVNRTLTHYNS